MRGAIRVMDPHLAAKIAAGEVIERPASVVKELVENALDAGALHIRVEIEGGGADRILVADDGYGIAADEVELAFRRHATSKLRTENDLNELATLGFRGEALPSIAAVADVVCSTRVGSEAVGVELRVDGGALEQQPLARQAGTTMVVDGLFARFPARRKFLRARSAEAAACVQVVASLALGFPEVQFAVLTDGREALRTPGDGSLQSAFVAVLGTDAAEHLLDVPRTTIDDERGEPVVEVDGVCASGSYNRAGRSGVTVLVNRRPVTNRTLTYAVVEAYGLLVPVGRQPVAAINVRVPPSEVDFNVHPSKLEVKLLRERAVYATVQRALRLALASSDWPVAAWADDAADRSDGSESLRDLRVLGQAGKTYLIAEGDAGVYLVDQHAAHERVLLEDLRASLRGRSEQQLLLEPVVLDVPPAAVALADQATSELDQLGFAIEPFGPRQVLLRGVPAVIADRQPQRVLQETLVTLATNTHGLVIEQHASWAERLAIVVACRSAVRAGDTLAQPEMEALLRRLGEASICRTCAHGRPTAILLSHAQLEREFGRR
ncbi:MAG TPA: DNA mismatch repair endonuclease MutL [Chloroflexota bacterium]|nr:DNA mismatch repair endonuclease MutL [Chloroflexota bacterium]